MQSTETAALLEAAPEQHSRRCALTKSAIDANRWPAAACNLRTAASLAQEWADRARKLADWCDAQAESGRLHSTVSTTLGPEAQAVALEPAGQPTLEALEAGLMALAHGVGRDHAMRARRAMNGVLTAQQQGCAVPAGAAA